MPQARRSTSSSRFKQPPALRRLSTSLETAQKALAELSKGGGRDLGKGADDLYKGLRTFVTNARRDSNKLSKALQREFDQAQKQLTKAAKEATGGATRKRSTAKRATTKAATTTKRATKRATPKRAAAKGSSTASRSSSSRSTTARGSSAKSTGGATKRTASKRGSSKS